MPRSDSSRTTSSTDGPSQSCAGTAHTLIGDRPPVLRQSKPSGHPVRRLSQLQLVGIAGGKRSFGKAVGREYHVGLDSSLAPEFPPRGGYGIGQALDIGRRCVPAIDEIESQSPSICGRGSPATVPSNAALAEMRHEADHESPRDPVQHHLGDGILQQRVPMQHTDIHWKPACFLELPRRTTGDIW